MTKLHARTALLPEGWAEEVALDLSADGRILGVETGVPQGEAGRVDILLPAPANLHSHAFQRAMSGLTERRGEAGRDSFWTWRQWMYRFLDRITPEDAEALAAQVQAETLEAGFAAIGEFHYLHHAPDGQPYGNPAEMSARICAAADQTGIGLTLLPVLYQQGGADGRPLGGGQRRFGCGTDQFFSLRDAARRALSSLPDDACLGVAPHSLRAVPPGALRQVIDATDGPLHIHAAEQLAEVEEIRATLGARPVEWLLENAGPDSRWCLVHCTQMTPQEAGALARTGAVAGLCPITEANLGDGVFDGPGWLAAGGALGVGSDSNVRISLTGELRLLEYSQRLRDRARAVLAPPGGSTGRALYDAALAGGAQALGRDSGRIAAGCWADLVALDGAAPDLAGRSGDAVLDTWIFGRGGALVRDVWAAGRHVVRDGRHVNRDTIANRFRATMTRLAEASG
ncbi:MAG: formimidoylglutamate deiminase [Antarcticimicrobium sp.]|uniref:formimidoylglutamate deiminase n=1 Tax=Antarcticimicrobium sp. TaxID=2824147 RepID=UPI002615743F|nr:formimidoylglutamate deiminase [Antarcticimicrobium sp.]MDF1716201.1 formimidoylglutamate deiminase [Antarcticimicrobium sp.]